MESVGRFCFYNSDGTCNFLRNAPTKCNLCPNFISFRKEALGLMNLLPIVPLDGGYVLLNTPLLQKNRKARDAIVTAVSLFVLF